MNALPAARPKELLVSPSSIGFLRRFLAVLIAVMVVLAMQSLWVNDFQWLRIWDNCAIISISIGARALLKRHRVRLAVIVTLWGTWLIVCGSISLHLGLHNPATLSFPLFLMLSGWLLGRKQAIGMAGATAALLFTLATLQSSGVFQPTRLPSPWLLAGTISAILALGVLISTAMADHIQAQYLELREISQTLELRVQERTHELSTTVDQLQQMQLDLARSERMAALGSLVAGVSHELNTPIGNGLTVASTLQDQARHFSQSLSTGVTRTALSRFVEDVLHGTDLLMASLRRAVGLVSSFKQVAVDQTSEHRRSFGLLAVVQENLLMLGPALRMTPHSLTTEIPDDLRMDSYPGPLGQVLTNLINNALLHGLQSSAEGHITLRAQVSRPGWIELRVGDDGAGIAPEHLARVFDPFFTTRLGQGGSGLGLSIVYNIVTQTLGGTIRVESKPGQGACFTLDLPATAPTAAPSPMAA